MYSKCRIFVCQLHLWGVADMITNFYFGTVKVNIMFGLLYGYALVRVTFTYFVDRVTNVAQFGASGYTHRYYHYYYTCVLVLMWSESCYQLSSIYCLLLPGNNGYMLLNLCNRQQSTDCKYDVCSWRHSLLLCLALREILPLCSFTFCKCRFLAIYCFFTHLIICIY